MLIYYLQMLDTPKEKIRFDQIYLKYRSLMYHVADSVLHNRQDAVHNAFLRIIKQFSRFQNIPRKESGSADCGHCQERGPARGSGRPCRAAQVQQRLPCAGGQLCPAPPNLPGCPGDEAAAGILRQGDCRQAGSDQNDGQHPDQLGPPTSARYCIVEREGFLLEA